LTPIFEASSFFVVLVSYTNFLISGLATQNTTAWTQCLQGATDPTPCINQWGSETAMLACQYAYTDVDGTHIQVYMDAKKDSKTKLFVVVENVVFEFFFLR
jgi:hypothetical protein